MIAVAAVAGLLGVGVAVRDAFKSHEHRVDRVVCTNNLKFIGIALLSHLNWRNEFPGGTVSNASLPPEKRLSWYVSISPYLETDMDINKSEPWDSPANAPFAACNQFYLGCPAGRASRKPGGPVPTRYVGIAGLGVDAPTLPKADRRAGVFGYDRATKSRDITDGLSTTMMVAETWDARGSWLAGGPATVRGLDPARQPYIGPGRQFGGLHRGGVNVLFADGSVRTLSPTIDPRVFEALSTIAGGERLPEGWDR
jgi:prepilin-type processing-associated H-X9-DG protein